MLQFTHAGEASAPFVRHRRVQLLYAAVPHPGARHQQSPDFTARLVLVFAVSTIVCLLLYSVHSYITSLRTRKRMELFEREYQMLLEQYRHLDARKEEEIRELHHEIRNCILTLQSLKHGSTHSKEGKES